jgi:nucleoside permease NupC
MVNLVNLVMLVCASMASMAFSIFAAYAILRMGFALIRPRRRPAAVKTAAEMARVSGL